MALGAGDPLRGHLRDRCPLGGGEIVEPEVMDDTKPTNLRSENSVTFERPSKINPHDVIEYEVQMLEYCATRLVDSKRPLSNPLGPAKLVLLEAFLLHFRVLLEFFGTPSNNAHYRDNLYFQRPESCGLPPCPKAVAKVQMLVAPLHAEWNERLNKFLAHPTERRYTTPRSWPVYAMRAGMRELVEVWRSAREAVRVSRGFCICRASRRSC
jgi:hypothetical protein